MNQTKNDQDLFELRNLLLTNPGENLSNPDYGVGLRRFIFEQNTSSALGEIEFLISDQISRFGPALNILSINVISNSDMIDRNAIGVKISYRSMYLAHRGYISCIYPAYVVYVHVPPHPMYMYIYGVMLKYWD